MKSKKIEVSPTKVNKVVLEMVKILLKSIGIVGIVSAIVSIAKENKIDTVDSIKICYKEEPNWKDIL